VLQGVGGSAHAARGFRVRRSLLAAMLVCAACAGRVAGDGDVRRQRLEADHRALMAQLDDLQARLLVDAERVRFWDEMRDRHASVSAIACTSQETHAIAMAEYLQHEQTLVKRPAPARRQARVAALRQPPELAAQPRRR
jgi:hypothetical protein